jgi:hypothetical protein
MHVARWMCWLYPLGCEGFFSVLGLYALRSGWWDTWALFIYQVEEHIFGGFLNINPKWLHWFFALSSNLRFVSYVSIDMLQSGWNDHIPHYNVVHKYSVRDYCFLLVVRNVGIPIFHLRNGPKVGLIWFLQTISMVSQNQIDISCHM